MANWQLLLQTLTDVAKKTYILPPVPDLDYVVNKLCSSQINREVLLMHIQEYNESHKYTTQKNHKLAKQLYKNAQLSDSGEQYNNLIKAQLLAKKEIAQLKDLFANSPLLNRLPRKAPELEHSQNFKCASKKLKLSYSSLKGRHVVCAEDVKKGELLFVEKPEAFIVNQEFKIKFCHGCCARTVDVVPCNYCNEVMYCSKKCRDEQSRIHQYECGYLAFLQSLGVAHLALRCLLAVHPGQSRRHKELTELQFHIDHLDPEELFQYGVTALLLTLYLETCTDYFSINNRLERISVCDAILRHILQMVVNAHAIVYTCGQPPVPGAYVSTVTSPRVATAIYPSTAMMNHSCQPNIVNNFHGNVLVVRAACDLEAGDEVLNCYGPHFARMPRSERQDTLLQQYNFECECNPCSMPYDPMEIYSAFKCPRCSGPLTVERQICIDCDEEISITPYMRESLHKANAVLEKGLSGANVSLTDLIGSWRISREVLYCFHDSTYKLADEIAKRFAQSGCWQQCVAVLIPALRILRQRFGNVSPVVASEIWKLGVATEQAARLEDSRSPLFKKYMDQSEAYKKEANELSMLMYGYPDIVDDILL